jgi:hypothetical protein
MSKVDKIIKGESIGVIIHSDYGGGWYSWHGIERLLYDPKIVEILEDETIPPFAAWELIKSYVNGLYPEEIISGEDRLAVVWIPIGAKFRVAEYDGKESIVLQSAEQWLTA